MRVRIKRTHHGYMKNLDDKLISTYLSILKPQNKHLVKKAT